MARLINEDGSVTVGILEDVKKSKEVVEETASAEEKPKKAKPKKK